MKGYLSIKLGSYRDYHACVSIKFLRYVGYIVMETEIRVGQTYREKASGLSSTVEEIFVDEDGEAQVRIGVRQTRRDMNTLLVTAEDIRERLANDEIELVE